MSSTAIVFEGLNKWYLGNETNILSVIELTKSEK